ncbi:MAG: hypothetical protein HYZ81_22125, partial [Nitrospinae bacterium]|nr:hypothetical protein [Nitrospinota bacterium]
MRTSTGHHPRLIEIYSNYKFPNTMASAIQAVRVAESFAGLGLRTTLFYRQGAMSLSQWKRLYDVPPHFLPRRYPGFHIRRQRLPLLNDLMARCCFAAKIPIVGQGHGGKILYGWNPGGFPLGFFLTLRKRLRQHLPLIACEAHEGKDWANTALADADVIIAVSGGVKRDLLAQG